MRKKLGNGISFFQLLINIAIIDNQAVFFLIVIDPVRASYGLHQGMTLDGFIQIHCRYTRHIKTGNPHGADAYQAELITLRLNLPTHAFELLNKSGDFLENALLFGQVLRIKRAHLGQNGIELSAVFTGKLPF